MLTSLLGSEVIFTFYIELFLTKKKTSMINGDRFFYYKKNWLFRIISVDPRHLEVIDVEFKPFN